MLTDYNYKFYVVNSKAKLVFGFDDHQEAIDYAKANNYRVCAKEKLKYNPSDVNNWTNAYPKNGLPEEELVKKD